MMNYSVLCLLFLISGISLNLAVPLVPVPQNSDRKGIRRGDILFHSEFFSPQVQGGWIGSRWRWPGGVVVYYIDPNFSTNERNVILNAMYEISSQTCITFREYNNDNDYVYIQRNAGRGCWSWYGRQGGGQLLSLDTPGCVYQGTIAHELIHAIGFVHEQSRPDRDDWVYIDYSNIQNGQESNFEKYSTSQVDTYNVQYDYTSVMHYGRRDFAANPNKDVITPIQSGGAICGSCAVRASDALKINRMYEGIC